MFVVGEGNDYSPIQQSYEIRKLRQENTRLKERLQAAKLSHSGEDEDDTESNDRRGPSGVSRAAAAHQRRFRTRERVDNLYFGTPGLANIVTDVSQDVCWNRPFAVADDLLQFANLQVELQAGGASLTHNMPRAQDMYAVPGSAYPFPILWQSSNNNASALVSCFPQQDEEIFSILESFQRRGQSCSFPHTPDVVTRKEVERFLTDRDGNAETFPDMLALIFATMATGLQMGQYDRSGGKWDADAVEQTRRQSDVYCE